MAHKLVTMLKANSRAVNIKKSVFISQSTDVYTNLALEEWLYKKFNFQNHHLLLIYRNEPCLVIGAQQNPWTETNVTNTDLNLARRSAKSGTIYQDEGCLNMSFFSPVERHSSKYNLDVVGRGVFRMFGCQLNRKNEDLLLRQNKHTSNNSFKQGDENSYHNMSLMVKSNKINRNLALQSSKATGSDSAVMNLCEETPEITISSLIKAIGWEYLRTQPLHLEDGGMELASKQKGFQLINPTETWFPGLNQLRALYSSWEWCWGETPKFNITRTFRLPASALHNNNVIGASASLSITMTVENGFITDITIYLPYEINSFANGGFSGEAKVIHSLKGKKFSSRVFDQLEDSLECLGDGKHNVRQLMTYA